MGELPQPTLRVDHERSADADVIRLVGELDVGNVDEAKAALMSAIDGEDVDVIVDMSELEFIDSSGISMLLEAQAVSRRDSDRLCFRGSGEEVAKILRLTRVDVQLRFVD